MSQHSADELDIFIEFAEDSRNVLDDINGHIESLYAQPQDLQGVWRAIHDQLQSIRDSADFLNLAPIYQLAGPMASFFNGPPNLERVDTQFMDLSARAMNALSHLLSLLQASNLEAFFSYDIGALVTAFEHLTEGSIASGDDAAEATPFVDIGINDELPEELRISITPEMLKIFLVEAEEQLEHTETCLLALEQNQGDQEAIDAAFRAMHTFKGNCGLFNYGLLEAIGHSFESVLEDYKSHVLKPDQKGINLMLKVVDELKNSVSTLETNEGVPEHADTWIKLLDDYQKTGLTQMVAEVSSQGEAGMLGEILVELGFIENDRLEIALQKQAQPLGEILQTHGDINEQQLQTALKVQEERRAKEPSRGSTTTNSKNNIRVDLSKLDGLITLVGELIVAENMVTANPDLAGHRLDNFRKAANQLNRISRDLQDSVMRLRMLPIGPTFRKMNRVVRDVAQKQGKRVELIIEGEETEIDKSMVEAISNPLLHLVRNAIDHGIEAPSHREASQKLKTGTIWLSAAHEGGEIIIQIRDDGRGIDPDAVLAKARQKGLWQKPEDPPVERIYEMIFEPGFSTAAQVTDISGRGVGMDVVRQSVETVKGNIKTESVLGQGTRFTIRIPLTLAIVEGMLVRVGYALYTIPLGYIRESLRCRPDQIHNDVDREAHLHLREELIPIIRLSRFFSTPCDHEQLENGIIVVVEHGTQKAALFADEIRGQYQTVIKSLSPYLGSVAGVSGTSILSDGSISLILNIQTIVNQFV
ncbi:chemotaxis protein CheA [Acanthopleuribacter pedis]|uniref:Chemotaxis protein CheA n=1 Tax=Acanthopleuribacter pedis TaxID=442870 RepID=A0A8J7U7F0_9BACT|nr:chemotaxis protein CheA [Acanthopleuribacter pedis]MBO1321336.1 chemotaxis protein CheW [Acanthopleuribacter pedis]